MYVCESVASLGRSELQLLLHVPVPIAQKPSPISSFIIAHQAFHKGFAVFIECLMDPDFLHAIKLTLMLAGVAVPVNVLFGLVAAINITRNDFPGKVRWGCLHGLLRGLRGIWQFLLLLS
jgi:sulfate transport system permease protein